MGAFRRAAQLTWEVSSIAILVPSSFEERVGDETWSRFAISGLERDQLPIRSQVNRSVDDGVNFLLDYTPATPSDTFGRIADGSHARPPTVS